MKNNISHTKGILDSYSKQFIDHNLFKETLLIIINLIKSLLILFQLKIKKLKVKK